MRKLFIVFWFLLYLLYSVSSFGQTVEVQNTNKNVGQGDIITTSLSLANSGNSVPVDGYLILLLPDQTPIFFSLSTNGLLPSLGTADPSTWTKFISNVTIPQGLDTGLLPAFRYMFTGGEPPGLYQWIFGLTDAGTLNVINAKVAPFFVSPSPVDARLGTWNITKTLPSLGGSGTGLAQLIDSSPGTLALTGNSFSAGLTSSYSYTGSLSLQGGLTWTMQGDIFGTQVQGSGQIDPNGIISGTINVISVGPFIQSITNITGTLSGNIINASYTVQYTNGQSGTEYLSAVRQ